MKHFYLVFNRQCLRIVWGEGGKAFLGVGRGGGRQMDVE